jgi:hypothetical protein
VESERSFELESEDFFTLRNLPVMPARSKTPLYGSGRMARESDLRAYLTPPVDGGCTVLNDVSFLLESADGQSLRGLFKRRLYIPDEIRRRNILIVGQIGSGKTQEHIIPMAVSDIADRGTSVVIVDFKGDLHQKLLPFVERYRPGTRVCVINLTNRKWTTHGWNPFALNLDSRSALEDAQGFCEASQTKPYNHDSPFLGRIGSSVDRSASVPNPREPRFRLSGGRA